MKQQQNGFASPSLSFLLRTAEQEWLRKKNTHLASPGDTVLSIRRSINKAGQTVLKAQRDPSAFTPWSVCTHACCSNSHEKPPSSCLWQRDLAVNIVFFFRNGACFTLSQPERGSKDERSISQMPNAKESPSLRLLITSCRKSE